MNVNLRAFLDIHIYTQGGKSKLFDEKLSQLKMGMVDWGHILLENRAEQACLVLLKGSSWVEVIMDR
jgi:hypothetical protein